VVLCVLFFTANPPVCAAPDQVIDCGVAEPTKDKPQSKVWYNDGHWYAWLPVPGGSRVWKRGGNGSWSAENYLDETLKGLPGRADVFASGDTVVAALADSSNRLALVALLYDKAGGKYKLNAQPQTLDETGAIETITVDRDRAGFYWIAYPSDSLDTRRIVVRIIPADCSRLGPPVVLARDVSQDDICVVVRMNGAIGVMWSNQNSESILYSRHQGGAPVREWWAPDTLARGNKTADDHINFCKPSIRTREAGVRLFAVTKTSLDTEGKPLLAAHIYDENHTWHNLDFATLTADWEPSRPVAIWLGDHPAAAYTMYGKDANRIELQNFTPDGMALAGAPVNLLGPLPELNNPTGPKREPLDVPVLLLASDRDGRVWEMLLEQGKTPQGRNRGPGGGSGGGGGHKGKQN
jgi:hypothetical protein